MNKPTAIKEPQNSVGQPTALDAASGADSGDPGQAFINWVLGYGYAAGHFPGAQPGVKEDQQQARAQARRAA